MQRRKEAVQLYYYQHHSKAAICRQLHCTRPWLDRWLNRYEPDHPDHSLQDHQAGPHTPTSPWSEALHQQVLEMRRQRVQPDLWPYALYGAAAIHYELQQLQTTAVPPVRTIHRWLVEAGLVALQPRVPHRDSHFELPIPDEPAVNWRQQLDFKGPVYLQNSTHKYYIAVLRDCWSHRCALHLLDSREARGIVNFLVDAWTWLGIPVYLQMDNALEFRGALRYPRSFGHVVRTAVDIGIEPVFNPPGEPWFNGGVERHNGFLEERFLQQNYADLTALQQELQTCQMACNTTHRVVSLDGVTPDELAAKACLRCLSPTYRRHRRALPQQQGFVSFIRRVRKSGRITLGPHDRFMVDPDLVSTYVWARVDLARQCVTIAHQGKLLKTYDYSADTVGKWAEDNDGEKTAEEEQEKSVTEFVAPPGISF